MSMHACDLSPLYLPLISRLLPSSPPSVRSLEEAPPYSSIQESEIRESVRQGVRESFAREGQRERDGDAPYRTDASSYADSDVAYNKWT